MSRHIKRVAILGSGVMGSAIAAHFANAGVDSLVLDIVPRELTPQEEKAGLSPTDRRFRDRIARQSIEALRKARPAPLFTLSRLARIEIGNLEDDLQRLAEADWVIEVVREDLEIKRKVLAAAAAHLADHAILSSNTSGISLRAMLSSLPAPVRPRFLGTHFFNPPRYMKLLELIPTPETDSEVIAQISAFGRDRLGKGVVEARDTPNFIANRIGVHSMMVIAREMEALGLTVEEVDALTGPAMGRPKTATFRLADLVGLDTLLLVAGNVRLQAPEDESVELFQPPAFLEKMVEAGLLGAKSGSGFYRKVRKPARGILTLDLGTLEYREPVKPELPELRELKGIDDPAERLRRLIGGSGRAAEAAWRMLAPTLLYAARRVGEISESAADIDRAMRLGFNWELGPFEIWDALGFAAVADRLKQDGESLPDWVEHRLQQGLDGHYRERDGRVVSPTAEPGGEAATFVDPRAFDFPGAHRRGRVVRGNDDASLVDLGEEVLGLEFHSKMNAIGSGTIEMIGAAVAEAESSWRAIVVGNGGDHFSAGANLMMVAGLAQASDWKGIEAMVRGFQQALGRLERCAVPVVIAPQGMALGGGCEVVLAGNAIQAAAETYAGLVEVGAGLIPAGGGCMRLYARAVERCSGVDPAYDALKSTFERIGMAKVSGSAEEAAEMGILRPQDGWSMNADQRILAARDRALAMAAAGFPPPAPRREIPVLGRDGLALIESGLFNMAEGRFISGHDRRIGGILARVLAGGDLPGPTRVAEQHLLDLEVEGFLSLCGEPKTHERIEALLKTGKPLRN